MRIEFTIDELVLIGVDARDRHRVRAAVELAIGDAWASGTLRPEAGRRSKDHSSPSVDDAVSDAVVGGLREELGRIGHGNGVHHRAGAT